MIKFSKKVTLSNGATINYFAVGAILISANKITVAIDGFIDKEKSVKAFEKKLALVEQKKLTEEFISLQSNTAEMSEEKRAKLQDLQSKINSSADTIATLPEYSDLVVYCQTYDLPYIEAITEDYIFEEIKKLDMFNNAKLDSK